MSYWFYVPMIVQWQSDGISNKDDAVVQESLGQVATSYLTILKKVDDNYRCLHSLIYFGFASVDFVALSLNVMIPIEFGLGFTYADHTFANSFNETVFYRIIFMCSWRNAGCPHWSGQFSIDLCRRHSHLYIEINGTHRGRVMISLPFGLGTYRTLVVL